MVKIVSYVSHAKHHFYNYIVLNFVVSVRLSASEYWPSRMGARRRTFAILGSFFGLFLPAGALALPNTCANT